MKDPNKRIFKKISYRLERSTQKKFRHDQKVNRSVGGKSSKGKLNMGSKEKTNGKTIGYPEGDKAQGSSDSSNLYFQFLLSFALVLLVTKPRPRSKSLFHAPDQFTL